MNHTPIKQEEIPQNPLVKEEVVGDIKIKFTLKPYFELIEIYLFFLIVYVLKVEVI